MSPALTAHDLQLVQRYGAGVSVVEAALIDITEDELDRRTSDGWSARMVVHHLADSETNSYLRLRRLLVEPAPTLIQGYDEALWAASDVLGYQSLPIERSMQVFRAVRSASAQILERIGADDLDRAGVHSESGPYTLRDWVEIYAAHAEDHAAQIGEARGVTPRAN